MNHSGKLTFLFLAVLGLGSCAARRYQPEPIHPAKAAVRLESRTLQDLPLRAFLEKNLGHAVSPWPPRSWDLRRLTLAAFYFNPDLEIARARAGVAEAAILTAKARPNPTLRVQPGVPSPYLFGLGFLIPVQTAGRRGHRIERAERLSEAARLDLANTAWRVEGQVRRALVEHLLAMRNLALKRTEERLRAEQVKLLEQRLAVGEMARPFVDTARIRLSRTRLAVRAAEGRIAETRAALAAAIGVPTAGLEGAGFSWPSFERPPNVESLSAARIQREAVLNRLDVRRALADYAAAEAALQLEIARQYPNFSIGPGYQFEEADNFFTLGFSAALPIFNRNQGPIAEAEARRKETAARFLATQAQVIAQSEQALARYHAALQELEEAQESLAKLQTVQEHMVRRAVQIGESDRMALNGVQLRSVVTAEAELGALGRAQVALGELENAVQRPLQPDELALPASGFLDAQAKKGARP